MKIISPDDDLLSAYAHGIFPMADSKESDDVDWYSASRRGIIPYRRISSFKECSKG